MVFKQELLCNSRKMLYKSHIQMPRWFCPSLQVAALKKIENCFGCPKKICSTKFQYCIAINRSKVISYFFRILRVEGIFYGNFHSTSWHRKIIPKLHLTNSW